MPFYFWGLTALAPPVSQEGFIPDDSSPAVLKTELPPALERVAEQATTPDALDGEILLENEALPGHEGPSQPEEGAGNRCMREDSSGRPYCLEYVGKPVKQCEQRDQPGVSEGVSHAWIGAELQ